MLAAQGDRGLFLLSECLEPNQLNMYSACKHEDVLKTRRLEESGSRVERMGGDNQKG